MCKPAESLRSKDRRLTWMLTVLLLVAPPLAAADLLNEFQQCMREHPVSERSPCNWFVGKAVERLWGLEDFRNPAADGQYLTANAIADAVAASKCWVSLGTADTVDALEKAAGEANDQQPVIAVYKAAGHGHVALVLPGPMTYSPSWSANVPNSASFRLDSTEDSYVGKPLSSAFGASRRSATTLYVRRGGGRNLAECVPFG